MLWQAEVVKKGAGGGELGRPSRSAIASSAGPPLATRSSYGRSHSISAATARRSSKPSIPPTLPRSFTASRSRPRAKIARRDQHHGLVLTDVADFSVKGAVGAGASIDDWPVLPRRCQSFPDEHRNSLAADVPLRRRRGRRHSDQGPRQSLRGGGRPQLDRGRSSQPGVLPNGPCQGRHFDPRVGYFTRSFEDYASQKTWMERRPIHRPLPPGEEGPECRGVRAGQADRFLLEPRDSGEWGART